ncbi:hypothetical protein [Qipengyuania sp. 902]|uniref:hypothetical protein n=1 Tax=Qipengyuania sp. 902 TaxID=3417565 RepID=UPI003EBB3FF9
MQEQNTQQPQEQSRGMQTIWICLAIFTVGFIGIGIALQDEENCKGFMGSEDRECVIERGMRAADRLMSLPVR